MRLTRFAKYAWFVLTFNLGVILWGAYVRATGSGAGCGSHWPLCNGEVIPRAAQIETLVEFAHRATSGMAFLFVAGLLWLARRSYPPGNSIRWMAHLAMLFMVAEALVGAGLVLFEWVADDASLGRAIAIVVHLVNTFMLVASLALTAWWGSKTRFFQLQPRRSALVFIIVGVVAILVLGASGALAALGDTLFPAESLLAGIRQDFSSTAHFLVRLRIYHPTIALIVGVYLLIFANWQALRRSESPQRRVLARWLSFLVAIQIAAGALNVLLLAPVWMQIIHLLLADAVWIVYVLASSEILAPASTEVRISGEQPALSLRGSNG